MAPARKPFDPFGTAPDARAEQERRLREAENVLDSYHHSTDVLAEVLQNAADAIDAKPRGEGAVRRIQIDFDARAQRITVADTGTGMSLEDLQLVFRPNISFKKGRLARIRQGRSRGEKGVGLSFLLLACDRLTLRTCRGGREHTVVVEGAASWARGQGTQSPPAGWQSAAAAKTVLGSSTYTTVTLEQLHVVDQDLFAMSQLELTWMLRTRTAVGNTAALFAEVGHPCPDSIDVTLSYTPAKGPVVRDEPVPYSYATPEDLLDLAGGGVRVYDFPAVRSKRAADLRRLTRNGAIRHVRREGEVSIYVFAMDGNTMNAQRDAVRDKHGWAPEEWQGYFVATRNMPAGIALRTGIIEPRGYERRLFVLVQYDAVQLDVGRKSLPGGTVAMLNRVIRTTWSEMAATVKKIAPAPRNTKAGRLAFNRAVRAALARPDLEYDIPYLKVPHRDNGVAAVFHELLGAGHAGLTNLHPLSTGVFSSDDGLLIEGDNERNDPMHVVFGATAREVVDLLERDEFAAQTAGLAIVWTVEDPEDPDALDSIDVEASPDGDTVATHQLIFDGLAGRDVALRVVALSELVTDR